MNKIDNFEQNMSEDLSVLTFILAGEHFGILEASVLEVVGLGNAGGPSLDAINHAPVLRLREQVIPVIDLWDAFDLDPLLRNADNKGTVLVVGGALRFGILVDSIADTQITRIQAPTSFQEALGFYLGNIIVADSVVPVLNPSGLMIITDELKEDDVEQKSFKSIENPSISLLLFEDIDGSRKAVPTEAVDRIELIKKERIEYCDGQQIIQYKEKILPVRRWKSSECDLEQISHVIVVGQGDQKAGLIVKKIFDVVNVETDGKSFNPSNNIWGSFIISGHATDVIDPKYVSHINISEPVLMEQR